jgi:hypothetical protein
MVNDTRSIEAILVQSAEVRDGAINDCGEYKIRIENI